MTPQLNQFLEALINLAESQVVPILIGVSIGIIGTVIVFWSAKFIAHQIVRYWIKTGRWEKLNDL